jgi:ABC-2 type transport system permease protein
MNVTPPVSAPKGAIYDLGYKRYEGPRRAPSLRWRVIMRHQIAMGWKTWWRFKMWLGMAVLTTVIAAAFMYFGTNSIVRGPAREMLMTYTDAALPYSIEWFCRAAFFMSLTIGAAVIAGDVQSGAFTFYFARSVEPRDYILGKIAGLSVLTAIVGAAGPVVLALLRIGLASSPHDMVAHLHLLPKALAIGLMTTLAYATIPLALSALASRRRTALALWAAYYLLAGWIFLGIGLASKSNWIMALDIATGIKGVAYTLFGMPPLFRQGLDMPIAAGVVSVASQIVVAITIAALQIRASAKSGIGGSS